MREILNEIQDERERQQELKKQGRFRYTAADVRINNFQRFVMISEEIGEVAREVFTQPEEVLASDTKGTKEGLRKELIQVAAIAVAWIQGLDNGG